MPEKGWDRTSHAHLLTSSAALTTATTKGSLGPKEHPEDASELLSPTAAPSLVFSLLLSSWGSQQYSALTACWSQHS